MSQLGKFSADQMSEFREAFGLFDFDGDGIINSRELEQVLRSLGQNPDPKDMELITQQLDKDENGTIEFQEFLTVMGKIMENLDTEDDLVEVFRVIDQDGDGYISKADLREVVARLGQRLTEADMEEMMAEADLDGDNQISFDEFVKIVLSR